LIDKNPGHFKKDGAHFMIDMPQHASLAAQHLKLIL